MLRRRAVVAGALVLSVGLGGCADVAADPGSAEPSPSATGTSSAPTTTSPTPSSPTTPSTTSSQNTRSATTPPNSKPTAKPTVKPKRKPAYYALRVEQKLDKLGYPVGDVDGEVTARTRQALCAWRETNGMPVSRASLTLPDAYSVLAATAKPVPTKPDGIYVNKTCQVLYQVVGKTYKRIVWVSTGAPGYDTPNRTGKVWRKWAGAHESSLYDDAYMYDSIYFLKDRPGIALHGSRANTLIKTYPASHRCVRVMRPQIHQIFEETTIGTTVSVYGKYDWN